MDIISKLPLSILETIRCLLPNQKRQREQERHEELMDIISTLPLCIIETILCLLPIQEAARTSILSKEWRYHWIKIPNLAFDEKTFKVSTNHHEMPVLVEKEKKHKLMYAINQVLLKHEGPLLEFTLSMSRDEPSVKIIDDVILLLSKKNTVKKFRFESFGRRYKVPIPIISLRKLTDLCLIGCTFDLKPPIDGFGSLTNLILQDLCMPKKMLLHLLSKLPSLKNLETKGSIVRGSDESTIINLFECLPVIENLSISMCDIECFAEDGVPEVFPTALVHLGYLFIKDMFFHKEHNLPIFVLLIKSSPHLEKLKIQIGINICMNISISTTLEEYSDIWWEHLNEFEITNLNMVYELDFVKLILAKSPMLKKVKVFLYGNVTKKEELEFSQILLCSPHASSVVEIIVEKVKGSVHRRL